MKSDWQDPSVQGINRLKPHCSLMPCRSLEEAFSGERGRSACFRSLNGRWRFLWSAIGECPEGFESESLDDSSWEETEVPGCWQLQGDYDPPHYTNWEYPIPLDPPFVPTDNPNGFYRRRFYLPAEWKNGRVYLCFEGVYEDNV